jgi:hypothetical protein
MPSGPVKWSASPLLELEIVGLRGFLISISIVIALLEEK